MAATRIHSPNDAALATLCDRLAELATDLDKGGRWPTEQLRLCGEYGVYEWFLDVPFGGQAWSDEDVVRGYLALSAACLTTTFILTQRTGACRRIAGSENQQLAAAHGTRFYAERLLSLGYRRTTCGQHRRRRVDVRKR